VDIHELVHRRICHTKGQPREPLRRKMSWVQRRLFGADLSAGKKTGVRRAYRKGFRESPRPGID